MCDSKYIIIIAIKLETIKYPAFCVCSLKLIKVTVFIQSYLLEWAEEVHNSLYQVGLVKLDRYPVKKLGFSKGPDGKLL